MTTKEFNRKRTEFWEEKFTKDESRIWLMVGMKENGAYTFMTDEGMPPLDIADKLEAIVQGIRKKNSNTN